LILPPKIDASPLRATSPQFDTIWGSWSI
jgi:hypothetical protein